MVLRFNASLEGYNGLDDPISLMDGSLVFSEPGALRLHSLDPETNRVSVLVAESNESHGVTQDAAGRLISAQAWDGSTRIGVIYPPESEAVLADNYDGEAVQSPQRPNRRQGRRHLLYRSWAHGRTSRAIGGALWRQAAGVASAGGCVLHPTGGGSGED